MDIAEEELHNGPRRQKPVPEEEPLPTNSIPSSQEKGSERVAENQKKSPPTAEPEASREELGPSFKEADTLSAT